MSTLREFLKYRDSHPVFDAVKASGAVGIPCTVINDGEKVLLGKPSLDDLQ